MAGNSVTLTFAGDSKSLEKTFDKVGAGAKDMAGHLDKAEGKSHSFGGAMEKAAEATDKSESKFMGTADVLDGLGAAFGLPTDKATGLFRAFGDLSGGFAQIGPLIGSVGGQLGTLATGPVGLTIAAVAALATGIVVLYKNSETFRDIVTAAFNAVKAVVGPIIDTVGGIISKVVGWFGGGGKASDDMADQMKEAADRSQQTWENWNDHVTSELDDIINPLNRARDNSKVALEDIKTNLDDNVKFYDGWINNLKSLTDRGFGELANYLYSLGPTAEKAVGQAYNMTDPQLKKLQDNIETHLKDAGQHGADALVNGIGGKDYATLGKTIGQQIMSGIVVGMPGGSLSSGFGQIGAKVVTPDHRAAGGPVSAGTPYIVGEHGPELFVPGMSGGIVPNGGGSTVVVNVYGTVTSEENLIDVIHQGLLRKQDRTPLGIAS
jgi:gas vesicle protein